MRTGLLVLLAVTILAGREVSRGEEALSPRAAAFAEEAAGRVLSQPSVRGDTAGWFFLTKELRHLSTGAFWNRPWEEVAANATDPLPSILEFHNLLEARDIPLFVVPVPAKASIYPEKLDAAFKPGDVQSIAPFLARIREAGIETVDLESVLISSRKVKEEPLYCAQDAHFSPAGIETVVDAIAAAIGPSLNLPGSPSGMELSKPEKITIEGDLVAGTEFEGSVLAETLSLRYVSSEGQRGVDPDPRSPVLLLGDSHTLVFHQGAENGMHCRGSGVHDLLSFRLGVPLDLVGVRGSGLVQARKQLFYRAAAEPGYWEGKKVVVWMFSVREFTQSTDKPIPIPLDRP